MKYVVTGGAGFIGSHIVEELVARGEDVVVFDNFFTGHAANIEPFEDDITVVEGDLRDRDAVRAAVDGADFVLNQAARRSVPHSMDAPNDYNDVNINGLVNVLEVAKEAGVQRVVHASSSSVYGDVDSLPQSEGEESYPASPYALTKRAGEFYLKIYSESHDVETVGLRYFNVFGPRQDPESDYAAVIPIFMRRLYNDKPPVIFGDGEQTRDFTYVKNVVEANLKACHADGVSGEMFNVANGDRTSVNELARALKELLGKDDIDPVYDDPRPGDVRHTQADPSKARALLDYEGRYGFEEGLRETVEWFVEEHVD